MLGGYLGLRRQRGIDFEARPWVQISMFPFLAVQSWATYFTLCAFAFPSLKWASGGHLTGLDMTVNELLFIKS